MKPFLLRLFINAVALLITASLVEGIHIEGFTATLLAALILGAVNAVIRPIFLIFTLPLNVLTLGLFTLVINGLMLKLVGALAPGFYVGGFFAATFGALVLSLVSIGLTWLLK